MEEPADYLQLLHELDARALSMAHDEYFPQIYRYARHRLPSPQQAEDTASEVFLRLVEALVRGKGPRINLRGWLFQTASNVISDHYRSQRQREEDEPPLGVQTEHGSPESGLEIAERMQDVRRALIQLTEEQQRVIALRFAAGMSLRQTAEAMDRSPSAVKSLQFRAVAALRDILRGDQR